MTTNTTSNVTAATIRRIHWTARPTMQGVSGLGTVRVQPAAADDPNRDGRDGKRDSLARR